MMDAMEQEIKMLKRQVKLMDEERTKNLSELDKKVDPETDEYHDYIQNNSDELNKIRRQLKDLEKQTAFMKAKNELIEKLDLAREKYRKEKDRARKNNNPFKGMFRY